MNREGWLKPSLVRPALASTTIDELVQAAAEAFAAVAGLERARIQNAFLDAMRGDGFSIGGGVAIPHVEMTGLTETLVCLVTLSQPLSARSVDGRPLDIFLFILSQPDPEAHLLLLARLARLTQSRTFREGLRGAKSSDEVIALVHAAEARHAAVSQAEVPAAKSALIFISISGEKAVDAFLVDLVDQGLGDACLLEAQSVQEAAAREVPLFAGFRDLFGDPGGRRMLVVETSADLADNVVASVTRVSREYGAKDARVSMVPVQARWALGPAGQDEAGGKH